MWLMAMFDLPVTTAKARKRYTAFRVRDNFDWRVLGDLGKLLAYVVSVTFTHARSTRWKRRRECRRRCSPIR
jgi:CRISPR/Cas system-associated protein endoribonuclease Cas2